MMGPKAQRKAQRRAEREIERQKSAAVKEAHQEAAVQPRARGRVLKDIPEAEVRAMGRAAAVVIDRGDFQMMAALEVGIALRTFRLWLSDTTDNAMVFQSEVLPAMQRQAVKAAEKAEADIACCENGSSAWANWHKWKLERLHARVFAAPAQVELSGPGGGPIETKDVKDMPTAALVAMVQGAEDAE